MMLLNVKLLQTKGVKLQGALCSMLPILTQVALHLNNSTPRISIRISVNFNSNNNLLNNLGSSFLLKHNHSLLSSPDSNFPNNQVSFNHNLPRISSLLKTPNNFLPNSNSLLLSNQL